MRTARKKAVGRFSVEMVVSNFADVANARAGMIPPEKVRRVSITGVVDTGAMRMVLPAAVAEQLGLVVTDKVKVRYASGQTATRENVDGVYVEMLGRHGTFSAVIEPKRKDALIGAVVLEDLDFIIDPVKEQLLPRDPRIQICELE